MNVNYEDFEGPRERNGEKARRGSLKLEQVSTKRPAPSLTPQQLLQLQMFGRQPGYSSPYAPPAPAPLLPVGAPPLANPAAAQMLAAYLAQVAAQAQARGPPAPGAPAPVEAEPAPAPAAS